MKKVLVALTLCASLPVLANNVEKNRAMFDMMLSMAKNESMAELEQPAQCLGVPVSKLSAALERAMTSCFEQLKHKEFEAFMAGMETCVEPAIVRESGFSQQQLDNCQSPEDKAEEALALLDNKIDTLSERLDNLYDDGAGQQAIRALEQELGELEAERARMEGELAANMPEAMSPQAAQQEMEAMLAEAAEFSEKTLHLVTLPIYQNSQVLMHMFDGAEMFGVKTLPAATFASSDSADTILAYYRAKLPKFAFKKVDDGEYVLMESMAKGFDMTSGPGLKTFVTTPHVYIRSVDNTSQPGLPDNAKATIELAYREKGK